MDWKWELILTSVSLIFLALIGCWCVDGQTPLNCKTIQWNTQNKTCPEDDVFKELYTERSGENEKRLCCNSTHQDFDHKKKKSKACRVTACTKGGSVNLCSTFYERYVDGVKMEYEEIVRESCTKKSGSNGMVGYCCVKGSLEGQLATMASAEENEFRHQVKFFTPNHCGGTIYNKKYIISASHCVINKKTKKLHDVKKMKVILGSNLADMNSEEYTYGVKRAIAHPQYSRLLNDTRANIMLYNDVALLELDREIKFGKKVKALKIPEKNFNPMDYSKLALAIGWGTTDTGDVSVHLQKFAVVLRSDKDCFEKRKNKTKATYSGYKEFADQIMCAGGTMNGIVSPMLGSGDSGGGAVCRDAEGKAVHCGIASFSGDTDECSKYKDEDHCLPGGLVEVSYFRKWIIDNAGPQVESTLYRPYLFGEPVDWEDYQHQVHITSKDGKSCGGTLIKPDVVVTSASCLVKGDGSKTGMKGVKITSSSGQTSGVKKVVTLSGYKRVGKPVDIQKQGDRVIMRDNYHKNDLALIKLKEKMNIDPKKLPSLPESEDMPEEAVEVSILRSEEEENSEDAPDLSMMRRNYNILEHGECQARMDRLKRLKLDVKVDSNLLCGVEKYSSGSLCDRELGGGLLCKGKGGKDVLCGVQVFRLCEFSIPNGFLNLALYKSWVDKSMEDLN